MPYLARLEYLALLDVWIEGRPRMRAWWEGAKAPPSFRAAITDPLTEMERHDGDVRKSNQESRARAARPVARHMMQHYCERYLRDRVLGHSDASTERRAR
jgi:hypothetical protein